MANTGFEISQNVAQYFTTGPNSGSKITSSFDQDLTVAPFSASLNGEEFNNIFTNEDPYFVSVGNGKYKIANGDNPFEGGDPEYLLNSDGGYFVININKIKADIITELK